MIYKKAYDHLSLPGAPDIVNSQVANMQQQIKPNIKSQLSTDINNKGATHFSTETDGFTAGMRDAGLATVEGFVNGLHDTASFATSLAKIPPYAASSLGSTILEQAGYPIAADTFSYAFEPVIKALDNTRGYATSLRDKINPAIRSKMYDKNNPMLWLPRFNGHYTIPALIAKGGGSVPFIRWAFGKSAPIVKRLLNPVGGFNPAVAAYKYVLRPVGRQLNKIPAIADATRKVVTSNAANKAVALAKKVQDSKAAKILGNKWVRKGVDAGLIAYPYADGFFGINKANANDTPEQARAKLIRRYGPQMINLVRNPAPMLNALWKLNGASYALTDAVTYNSLVNTNLADIQDGVDMVNGVAHPVKAVAGMVPLAARKLLGAPLLTKALRQAYNPHIHSGYNKPANAAMNAAKAAVTNSDSLKQQLLFDPRVRRAYFRALLAYNDNKDDIKNLYETWFGLQNIK